MLRATWSNVSRLRFMYKMNHIFLIEQAVWCYILICLADAYASSYIFIGTFARGSVHNRQIVRIVNLFVNYVVISLLVQLYSLSIICSIIHVKKKHTFSLRYVSCLRRRKVRFFFIFKLLKRVSITRFNSLGRYIKHPIYNYLPIAILLSKWKKKTYFTYRANICI